MNKIMISAAQVAVVGAATITTAALHLIGFVVGCAAIDQGCKLIGKIKKSKRNKK
jgi:hypothetical protein